LSDSSPPTDTRSADAIKAAAVRGAGGMIALSNVSRVVGLVGTLVITYFMNPEVIGEVSVAVVLVLTAGQLSTVGLGQYLVARPNEEKRVIWHIVVLHVGLGAIVLGGMLLLRHPLAVFTQSTSVVEYLPWLTLPVMLDRIGFVPERLLARDLRFRRLAGVRSIAELAYSVASVGLAMLGFGGMAIVYANVARSALRFLMFSFSVQPGDWLAPSRLEWPIYRRILKFGVPLAIGSFIEFGVSRWDNLLFAYLFGPALMGEYNLAYNLADMPADQIGEQIAEVLLPSLARMSKEERKRAVVFSTGMVALVVFPIAIGFGAVAETAVQTLLPRKWWDVAPMLSLLCALSVARPLSWQLESYLQVANRTRSVMILQFLKLCAMLAFVLTFGRLGPLWACVAVGIAFGGHAIASMWIIARADGIALRSFLGRCVVPLVACGIMSAAVLGVRQLLARADVDIRGVNLAIEVIAGALAYVAACLVIGGSQSRELVDLVRGAMRRRRGKRAPSPAVS
jgi:PST family polysaccharide transporter